jgi:hypothetical protein
VWEATSGVGCLEIESVHGHSGSRRACREIPISSAAHANARKVLDEMDAQDIEGYSSLGELNIAFRTDNNGPSNVGVVLIDPRGRRFGFDPLEKRAWDELPVAQGYIDCDLLNDAHACKGLVQICGPIGGVDQLDYSRSAEEKMTPQLQLPVHAQR